MLYIQNRTFDEIEIGDSATLVRTLTEKDIEVFAIMSGDINPAHLDKEYVKTDIFHKKRGYVELLLLSKGKQKYLECQTFL